MVVTHHLLWDKEVYESSVPVVKSSLAVAWRAGPLLDFGSQCGGSTGGGLPESSTAQCSTMTGPSAEPTQTVPAPSIREVQQGPRFGAPDRVPAACAGAAVDEPPWRNLGARHT